MTQVVVYAATLGLGEQTFCGIDSNCSRIQKLKWRKTPSQLNHLRSYIFWVLLVFVISELKLFSLWLFEPLTNCLILGIPSSDQSCSRFYNFLLYQANLYIHWTRLNIFLPPEINIHLESVLKFFLCGRGNRYIYVYMYTHKNRQWNIYLVFHVPHSSAEMWWLLPEM